MNENNVYTEVNLLALFEEKKLKGIRYGLEERYMDAKAPVVYLDRLEDVLDVATETNQPVIFYKYHYLEVDQLIITDDDVEEMYAAMLNEGLDEKIEDELPNRWKKEIDVYNRNVIDTNFKQPIGLSVFCLYEGNRILYEVMDFRVLEENHLHLFPDEALSEIIMMNILNEETYSLLEDNNIN